MSRAPEDAVREDLLAPEVVAEPYRAFGALREEAPVQWHEGFGGWLVLRYDALQAAFHDHAQLGADRVTAFYESKLRGPEPEVFRPTYEVLRRWMVFVDPPEHKRLRSLVDHAFRPKALADAEAPVAELVEGLLDEVADAAARGPVDWLATFAYQLPVLVISDMFGVPRADRDLIKGWSVEIMKLVFGTDAPDRHAKARAAIVAFGDYLREHIADRRARPREDLISTLVEAREDGAALSDEEVVATCILLLFGGHETTTNLLANGLLALLTHPAQMASLRAAPEARIKRGVEEMLRYDSPSKAMLRVARRTHTRGGHTLQEGDLVLLVQASANRDPRRFEAPGTLRLDRPKNLHVAFGYGIHYCIGAPLARLEGRVAFPRVLRRFPEIVRADEAPLDYHATLLNRGLRALPLRLRAS